VIISLICIKQMERQSHRQLQSIASMYANGWRRIPPATGILYQVTGRFNGEIYPIGTDGYPWHNGATSATNSTATPELGWSTPIRITGIDGTDGTDGTPGTLRLRWKRLDATPATLQ
jgi:hypothetical protein